MNKVRVRLFALLVVCIILVFSVLGLFLQQLISSSAEERTADQLKKESVYIAVFLTPAESAIKAMKR